MCMRREHYQRSTKAHSGIRRGEEDAADDSVIVTQSEYDAKCRWRIPASTSSSILLHLSIETFVLQRSVSWVICQSPSPFHIRRERMKKFQYIRAQPIHADKYDPITPISSLLRLLLCAGSGCQSRPRPNNRGIQI